MKFLSLILSALITLALFAVHPVRAADSWDIEVYDSCTNMSTEDQERIFGDDTAALTEHERYCCDKSGGVWVGSGYDWDSGGHCVSPPSNASAAASAGILKDWVNSGRLEGVCRNVDGLFEKGSSGKSYLCRKENCDLRGGECQIFCVKGRQCVFVTPDRLTGPVNLLGILQSGDNINRSVSGASSSGDEKATADEPAPPVFQ